MERIDSKAANVHICSLCLLLSLYRRLEAPLAGCGRALASAGAKDKMWLDEDIK